MNKIPFDEQAFRKGAVAITKVAEEERPVTKDKEPAIEKKGIQGITEKEMNSCRVSISFTSKAVPFAINSKYII